MGSHRRMQTNGLQRLFMLFFAWFLAQGFAGCAKKDEAKTIDFSRREPVEGMAPAANEAKPIRIAIGSMVAPDEGYAYYKRLLDYIGEKLGQPVEYVDRKAYAELNSLLKAERVDAAFVCGRPYVIGHKEFGLELLVVPQAYGRTAYQSFVIVPADSPARSLRDLRGKTFAFADPDSNSGKLSPTYKLGQLGERPETFFKSFVFTYKHDKSIKAVAEKLVDGAAVDSIIWKYLNEIRPELTSRTKVIEESEFYGIPPVVVPPGLAPKLKEKLRQLFLHLHEEEKGREILKGMKLDKFVIGEDRAYESIRRMEEWCSRQPKDL